MKAKGYIDPNLDELPALFDAIARELASDQTRLSLWLVESFDLSPLNVQPIGAQSPFGDSNSELAGDGFLLPLHPTNLDACIDVLADRADYEILHLEIEVDGSVQFAAYDHFCYAPFCDRIPLALLEDLKAREVIWSYELFESELRNE